MYGTVAKLRLKPGTEQQLVEQTKQYETMNVPGFVASYVYRMDNNPNEFMLTVLFVDKATYTANANNPAQNERYMKMRALLESDPEWNDGEVVYARQS